MVRKNNTSQLKTGISIIGGSKASPPTSQKMLAIIDGEKYMVELKPFGKEFELILPKEVPLPILQKDEDLYFEVSIHNLNGKDIKK